MSSMEPDVVARTLRVNGHTHDMTADPDSPLLLALRNDLGLNRAKVGCALSHCGACTVLRDGEPIRACITMVREAVGAEITTLEGIGTADRLHPVQQAFLDEQAAQCGYCIPGMMLSTAALLAETPDPTDTEIHAALAGNLCRCGAHVRIMKAVRRAARLMAESATASMAESAPTQPTTTTISTTMTEPVASTSPGSGSTSGSGSIRTGG